jgi:5-methyltetrahydropteroyltriglutamate--homocysteine methyltransferase
MRAFSEGKKTRSELDAACELAVCETIRLFEETGSPVITDGEQSKPSFATYPIASLDVLAPGGATIPFADGHTRQLPKLSKGPFRFAAYAEQYLKAAKKHSNVAIKQAVISASALSLLYPQEGVPGYPRETFIKDLLAEHEADIRRCLRAGAHSVQVDFTEARLSLKLDPSGGLLKSFVALNNKALERFTAQERERIGVHTCPGGDKDSTHSADVDYAGLLPQLFELKAGRFFIALSGEKDREKVLTAIRKHAKPGQVIFVGVTDPINPRVETPEEVRDQVLEAARFIAPALLGTTDDCGFSPFADDTSTSRDTAFAKIRARVEGTRLAAASLN